MKKLINARVLLRPKEDDPSIFLACFDLGGFTLLIYKGRIPWNEVARSASFHCFFNIEDRSSGYTKYDQWTTF